MKRRTLTILLALTLIALLLTACGGNADGSSGSTAAAGPSADADYDYWSTSIGDGYGFDSGFQESPEGAEEDFSSQDDRLSNAKMIYTANLEVETTDFNTCTAGLEVLVEQMGGYLEYASTNSYRSGYRSASYTVRVPAAQFTAFLNSVGQIGHVTYQDKHSENVSEAYYDTESRLVTQRTKLERLQALLSQAENMEDIITIESAISETEYLIEQLTGTLRHYDALVDFATISINLQEVTRLSTVESAPPTFLDQMSTAFTGGVNGFVDFLQTLAISLAYSWIWLLILAVIIVLAVHYARRKSKEPPFLRPSASPFSKKQGKKPDDKQPKE